MFSACVGPWELLLLRNDEFIENIYNFLSVFVGIALKSYRFSACEPPIRQLVFGAETTESGFLRVGDGHDATRNNVSDSSSSMENIPADLVFYFDYSLVGDNNETFNVRS